MANIIYEVLMDGVDIDGRAITGSRSYPAYTCGHCTSVIMLRADRSRPRHTCLGCGRWTCEKSEICNTHCTPMYDLARDHFEDAGEHGRYVNAIMSGAKTIDEAHRKGLLLGE